MANQQESTAQQHGGPYVRRIDPRKAFSPADPRIKEDITRLIIHHLVDQGYYTAGVALQDESSVDAGFARQSVAALKRSHVRIRKAVQVRVDFCDGVPPRQPRKDRPLPLLRTRLAGRRLGPCEQACVQVPSARLPSSGVVSCL